MVWQHIGRTGVFLATLAVAASCEQHYNGALTLAGEDKRTVEAYEAYRRAQERRLQGAATEAGAPGAARSAAVDAPAAEVEFGTPGNAPTNAQDRARGTTAWHAADTQRDLAALDNAMAARPDTVAVYATDTGHAAPRGRMNALGLFGDIDPSATPRTSPLDGPDNLARVTFSAEGADYAPDADPTGTWLVYASTRHRTRPDLYLKRVDGTTVTQLTNDPARDDMPAFSPDGQRVAFASDRSGNWDIYIMDVNGGQAVQVTSDPTHDIHPTWSPDGRRLAYCSYGGPSGQWEIVIVDLENPGTKRFVGHGLFPQWSPVEDKIVFQRARQRGTRWFSIWTIDLVDGEAVRPTEIAASANAACITPDWSPDGKHIVFCTVIGPGTDMQARPTQADVWVVGVDGTGRVRMTSGRFANLQPTWSSDGTVYFVSNRGPEGTENIWALQPDRAIQLAQPAGPGNPSAMVPTE